MQKTDYYPDKNASFNNHLTAQNDPIHGYQANLGPLTVRPEVYFNRVCILVSTRYEIALSDMISAHRHSASTARARQIAMYLCHTSLAQSYSRVGLFFKRDRTTVAHACARIEDLRDTPIFDREINNLENELKRGEVI